MTQTPRLWLSLISHHRRCRACDGEGARHWWLHTRYCNGHCNGGCNPVESIHSCADCHGTGISEMCITCGLHDDCDDAGRCEICAAAAAAADETCP